ncbi:hypothetical protein BJ165DRAFT_1496164 [Panaeolus papilionaceus]|nr:hypothetical protein BJ165DRAFT_1496164 [Panaeolus papilionaceus]
MPSLRMFKRVKALTLHCKQFPSLIRHQRMLEENSWTEKSSRGMLDDVPSTLGSLAESISRVVSETSGYGIGSPYGAHVVGRLGKEQALGVIRELKRCRVEDVDVKDIYIPQVQLQLQALEKWVESDSTKVKWKGAAGILKELQTAIKETLEKWYFALDEYSPRIHWVVISHTVLMYVPSDDPFRSTSDSIDLARVYDASSYLNPFHEVFSKGVCSDDL